MSFWLSFYIFSNARIAPFYRLFGHITFVVNLTYLGLSSYIFPINRGKYFYAIRRWTSDFAVSMDAWAFRHRNGSSISSFISTNPWFHPAEESIPGKGKISRIIAQTEHIPNTSPHVIKRQGRPIYILRLWILLQVQPVFQRTAWTQFHVQLCHRFYLIWFSLCNKVTPNSRSSAGIMTSSLFQILTTDNE